MLLQGKVLTVLSEPNRYNKDPVLSVVGNNTMPAESRIEPESNSKDWEKGR